MARTLNNSIKDNVITPYNKYSNEQERIAKVIDADKKKNRYTVSTISRDGILNVVYNVALKHNDDGVIGWAPDKGDTVKVIEQYKKIIIVGKAPVGEDIDETVTYSDIYSDGINGSIGGFIGL